MCVVVIFRETPTGTPNLNRHFCVIICINLNLCVANPKSTLAYSALAKVITSYISVSSHSLLSHTTATWTTTRCLYSCRPLSYWGIRSPLRVPAPPNSFHSGLWGISCPIEAVLFHLHDLDAGDVTSRCTAWINRCSTGLRLIR